MKVFLRTYGCAFNKFDSELIEFALKRNGFQIVHRPEDANIIIVNTCGVKKQTEDKVISYLKKMEKLKRKLIVTGCLPIINLKRLRKEIKTCIVTGPSIGDKIIDLIENRVSEEELLKNNFIPPLQNRCYGRRIIHVIPISHGCLGNCSYCAVKFARGALRSHSEEEILNDLKKAVKMGAKEIWLTAQDIGVYGLDIGTNLIKLLEKIDMIDEEFLVRIGMGAPSSIIKMLNDLICLFKGSEKFFYFLHIPVQSGSDRMLRIMRRPYSVDDFKEIVNRLRREVDEKFCIATDVIVGHPGEEYEDFSLTMELIREVKPDIVHISKFFPRPRTRSSEMKQIPTQVVKKRSVQLTALCNSIAYNRNKMWVGWAGSALVDEIGKKRTLIARNYAYKPIVIDNSLNLGQTVNLKIERAHFYWLHAKLI